MNDNSEGTPNPLNPGSDLAGAGNDTKNTSTEQASDPVQAVAEEQIAEFAAVTSGTAGPVKEPATPVATESIAVESVVNETVTSKPVAEPVIAEAASVVEAVAATPVAEPSKVEPTPVVAPAASTEPVSAEPVSVQPAAEPVTRPVATEAAREVVEPMIGAAPEAVTAQEEVVATTILEEPMHSLDISDFATPTPAANEVAAAKPMEQPAKKKGKKSKVGVVIAIILLLVAIGCGTAAALMLTVFNNNGDSDRVPAAVSKLLSGDLPQNVVLDGTISIVNDSAYPTSNLGADNLTIDFTSGINTATSDQYANVSVTAGLEDDMGTFKFDIDEIHLAEGDLYLRYKGIASALDDYYDGMYEDLPVNDGTNCITDLNGETNCLETGLEETYATGIFGSLGLFEAIENEWIKIPVDEVGEFSNITDLVSLDSTTQCLVDAAGELGNYDSDFKSKYEANPFITYSTENLKINKKVNTLYLLSFDNEKLAGFINSMMTSGFMNELSSCMGGTAISSNTTVTAAQVSQITAMLPAIYVEIDDNNNFTRVYLSMSDPDNMISITADISISYPASITIEEPGEYVDLSQVLSQVLSQFYGQEGLFEEMLDQQEVVLPQ